MVTGSMGSTPILPVINWHNDKLDGQSDGDGDGDGKCKHTLNNKLKCGDSVFYDTVRLRVGRGGGGLGEKAALDKHK